MNLIFSLTIWMFYLFIDEINLVEVILMNFPNFLWFFKDISTKFIRGKKIYLQIVSLYILDNIRASNFVWGMFAPTFIARGSSHRSIVKHDGKWQMKGYT